MSGKFMKVKRVFIPTLTALIIASQLVGCTSASQKEMLDMINNQQEICIEIAMQAQDEKGDELIYEWIQLADLENYEVFRMNFEDTLNVTAFGEGGKNGTMYVDLEGNHTNNSTFYFAMMNKKFRAQIDDTDTNRKLVETAKTNYADVDSNAMAKLAYINAYFNIFEDSEPNYFNGNSALTRAEFLSGVYRAGTPVQELEEDMEFFAKVDPNGENEHTIFAQQMLDYSYLNFSEKSLNTQTFSGDITRAEAVYTLVKYFYADDLAAVTGKEAAFADTKNGGDIASKIGFIETKKDEETKEKYQVFKDYWMSYELQYALDNPDKGMPDDLYNAMVVAKQKGLITGSESRWDEAITKAEAINFLVRIYGNMTTVTNADRGSAVGDTIETPSQESTGGNGQGEVDTPSLNGDYALTENALNPLDNITANPDGTYSFTDDFLVAVQGINGAAGLTEENLNKMLQEVAPMLIGLAESGISTEADVIGIIESYVGIYEYNQAVEQQKPQQNQNQQKPSGGTSQNNGGGNSNQQPSGGSSEPTYSGGDNAAGPGPLDSIFANPEDGTGDMTLGEGDGTHVGISH